MIKKMLCMALALTMLAAHAFADGYVNVKPGKNDLTQAQVKEYVVAFFAEKCGVEESVLHKADWLIQYGHSTVETAEDAVWTVYTRDIKGHPDVHAMTLTGPGEIIKWEAHGPSYDKPYPDLLDYATPVTPLSTDVQADTVIALVREEMVRQGFAADASALTVTPTFAYDEHFNTGGDIPVWLVLIEDRQDGRWKAAVSHKGDMLSLVPYAQVFREYRTPGEEFWAAVFEGVTYIEERDLFYNVIECTLSHEEKAEITARWRVLVEQWMAAHPYYLNNPGDEYIVTIERVYGIPDEKAIPEAEAVKLAGAALTERLGNAYLPNRDVRVDYLVNDPERPVWVIRFGRINGLSREERKELTINHPEATSMYNVTIDAHSGAVLDIGSTEKIY